MTIHQLSVFVENKSGTLLQVLELFKEAGIQLIASTISDTVEYGIYRIICSEPQRAYDTLKPLPSPSTIPRDRQPMRSAVSVKPESASPTSIPSCSEEKVSWCSVPTATIWHATSS